MRMFEGTPEELVEYQQLVAKASPEVGAKAAAGEEVPVGAEPAPARAAMAGLDEDDEDAFFIRQYIYGRSVRAATTRLILRFLERVAEKGTVIEVGESERTEDGLTDYLMVRDQGPRRFGAVAYVKPSNGGLTLRLRPEDVTDIDDERVKERNVRANQQYAINCPLVDDESLELAVELVQRALIKVRGD
jgi:hypothetical protein